MKTKTLTYIKKAFLASLAIAMSVSCERDISDDAVEATFPNTPDVFTDAPVGLTDEFFTSFDPAEGANPNGFGTDENEAYKGTTSIRIDVPSPNDPNGGFIGGIFKDRGEGRDLSGYDALTFWAKGSTTATISLVGFGTDFEEDKYAVAVNDITLSTDWRKYTIPIPDPSKLTKEKGMFIFSAGTLSTNGFGFTFWMDEIRFEDLGTVAQPRPAIADGNDLTIDSFIGVTIPVPGLIETFNLASGIDQTVAPAASYYQFTSSNPGVASVDAAGIITVNSGGAAVITATLNGMDAAGSITINSLGDFDLAPTQTRSQSDVISIFSDQYVNTPVDFYNGFWEPFQTTLSADFNVNGDNILNYTNFNFVGNQFSNPVIDITDKANLHLNMYIPGNIPSNLDFLVSVVDFGPDQVNGGGDDTRQQIFFNASDFVANTWSTLEVPITLTNKNNIGLIIYENINGSPLSNFYLDNIYFYGIPVSPTVAAPTPTQPAANVISVFSDPYTDIANDGLNNFDSGSLLSVENIASNPTLKYSNLNFTGLEFLGPNIIDASLATTLHLDVWSPDANQLKIKLVDFGADGAFGGGDDTEFEINLGATATNQWISFDIPLANFTGLASTENLAQIIFVNAPTGTLFIDNLYFYN